jgi:hypothetical protein
VARIDGWRAIPLVLVATALLLVLALLLFWVAVAAVVAIGLVALQLVLLPRLARRLGMALLLIVLILLPVCALGGWLAIGEATGPLVGAAAWAVLVGAPRVALVLAGRWLGRRAAGWAHQVRTTEPPPPSGQIIETVACPRCGRFRLAGPSEECPHCAAERPAIAPPA